MSKDPCGDGECMCSPERRLDWKTMTAEEFADLIASLPTDICIEKDGKCTRDPCCKNKPGEIACPGW